MRVLKKEKRTTINSIKGIVIDLRENKGKQEIRRENQDIRTKRILVRNNQKSIKEEAFFSPNKSFFNASPKS